MTPTPYHLPRHAAWRAHACISEDQGRLAEHRDRCLADRGGRWIPGVDRVRGFTVRHVVSVSALMLTLVGGLRLLS
jgi:hypothetical protein